MLLNNISIRPFAKSDYEDVKDIYNQGIATGLATFETNVPSWEVWDEKYINSCRLVAKINEQVVGFAALSAVSKREVYKGVAEVSVYVANVFRYQGIGKLLLNELISCSEKNGFWTLQASIFNENLASINLHKSCGFRKVGTREKIGKLNGQWYDNCLLERRSKYIL